MYAYFCLEMIQGYLNYSVTCLSCEHTILSFNYTSEKAIEKKKKKMWKKEGKKWLSHQDFYPNPDKLHYFIL